MILFRWWYWGLMALAVPGMLLRVNMGGTGLLPHDILLPLYAILWLCWRTLVYRSVPRFGVVLLPVMGFLVMGLIGYMLYSTGFDASGLLMSFAHWVRFASLLVFGWSTVSLFRDTPERYWRGFYAIAGLVFILGVLQYFIIPDLGKYSQEGQWDPHVGRLLSTWLDPNFIAGFIAFLLSFTLGKWYSTIGKTRLLYTLFLVLLGVCLILTYSRSGYLSAGFGVLVFFLFRDWRVPVVMALVGLLGLGVMSSDEESRAYKRINGAVTTVQSLVLGTADEIDPTANLRLQSWRDSLELWAKHPVVGIGFNTYRLHATEQGIVDEGYFSAGGSDSSLLNVLITSGLTGFLLYILWLTWLVLWRIWEYTKYKQAVHLGWAAGFLALVLHSFFVNSLFYPFILLFVLGSWFALSNTRQIERT